MRLFSGRYERAFGNKIFISIPFYIFLECLFGNRNREELLLRPPCDVYLEFPLSFFFLFNISIWKKRCSFFFQPKRSWRAAGEERRRRGGSEQHEKRIAYWIRFSLSLFLPIMLYKMVTIECTTSKKYLQCFTLQA